ncbi:2'-5' RNA ligase family protein [Corallococcus praedator]|uniref:2'-5' RNA ligase family protein n=1 Tax=Corallococcus praedator TaxID=2316724 RepID=A0ABX9QI41_9BACT|nr:MULTISPECIES: 2'-5' RNA ligase family protein [Corallococcus]RKH30599.1 2'-5' RNA ligase family protein [Corallococcus sp. CA031C]RKI08782.1 2'-5' RNA ligase family protein [Corallococcus praedator]
MSPSAEAPLLITAEADPESFARLDGLRRRYFPPERNLIPAHVSLFHHLPPREHASVEAALEAVAGRAAPTLHFGRLRRLGGGVAVDVDAPGLGAVHRELSRAFAQWLTPQDRQPFRPHVTLMNKAPPGDATAAFAELSAGWASFDGHAPALLLWRYLGGPWELVRRVPFTPGRAG